MNRADAGLSLLRALAGRAPHFTLETLESRPWASATFAGERHVLRIETSDDAALERWLSALPDVDLAIRGHLLADVSVGEVRRAAGRAHVTLEALTLVES